MAAILPLLLGAPLVIAWDQPSLPEVGSWRVWRGIELLCEVKEPKAVVRLPYGENSTLTVTAVGAKESSHSEPLHIYIPEKPRLTIQFSTDLETWTENPFPEACFFRVKVEYP